MTIHHATLAKAAKLGVVMTEAEETSTILAHWTEKNKRGNVGFGAGAAAALLADMQAWQMIVREYSNLKVEQPHVNSGNFVWEISLRGDVIGEGERLTEAFEDALDAMVQKDGDEGEADDSEPGDHEDDDAAIADMEEEAEEGKSIVKRKYKHAYRPFKMTCGDELSQLITKHLTVEDEEGKHIDPKKLRHFAKANGVWVETYAHLNIGQQRMNIANRLRKIVRDGGEVVWN